MTKTPTSNHFLGDSGAGCGWGIGTTKGCAVSCWVIFAGGMSAITVLAVEINGCAVACWVRVMRSADKVLEMFDSGLFSGGFI
jgi:hypothetical protein